MPTDCNQEDISPVVWVILGSVILLVILMMFQLMRKTGATWKMCFDFWCDCSCSGCECPDRCPLAHRTTNTNRDEEIAMEQGIIHGNGTNCTHGRVNGSNNHAGYTTVDATHIDHHDDEDDSTYSFTTKAAEEEPLL